MSKRSQDQHRARYKLEFKLEAVRLVKAGQEASVTARVLGVPKQTLSDLAPGKRSSWLMMESETGATR
jgi:transposase-like protein